MLKQLLLLFSALFLSFFTVPKSASGQGSGKEIVYVGTFSERDSKGIYVLEFDRKSGEVEVIQTVEGKKSPSFLAVGPQGKYLFAVYRQGLDQMPDWGSIASYAINQKDGTLQLINEQTTYGKSPCHISVYPGGRWLFVSHYVDGVLSVIPFSSNGMVGASSQRTQLKGSSTHPERQTGPHTHSATPSVDGSFLYVADLGIDKVMIYKFNNVNGTVSPAKQPFFESKPGSGPRHFAIHRNSEIAFLAEELSSTINAFHVNPNDGSLKSYFRRSTLAPGFSGENTVADIHVHPSGNNVYVSNRGENSIAIFSVVPETAQVRFIKSVPSGGDRPRNFMIDPSGKFAFVANRNSDNIVLFNIDDQGILNSPKEVAQIPAAVCLKYLKLP